METIKGFNDFTGEDALKRAEIKKILVETFEQYGFEPAETPIIEDRKFVQGENENDEAVSDIFKLRDKGNRELALRYEFTFQLKRIAKNKKLPYKRYQIGEVFRDEPASSVKARFRQFTQCDVDIIGTTIKDEAEVLATIKAIAEKLKIDLTIYFNNRKILNEILDEFGIKEKDKGQVIRIIDKLDKKSEKEIRSELKKYNAEEIIGIFKKPDSYFKKYKTYKEIELLKKYCKFYGFEIKFQPSLARGLSYYNGTVFEVKTKNGKESIVGGGAYKIGEIQCFGYGSGLERWCSTAKLKFKKEKILIISLNEDKQSIQLAQKLRKKGESVIIFYGKPSKALQYANSYNIENVIFIGKKEIKKKEFKIKNMKTGKEKKLRV